MLDVAVVILNWNGLFLLQKFIPILLKYNSYGYHIYIVDNGSTDDSIDWICDNYSDEIQVVALSENFGFAKGYNEGLKQIDADYYILLNSDVAVSENWCEPLINFLQNNHDYAVVQPKILSYKNPDYFEYAGAAGGYVDKWGYPFCRGRIFNKIEKDEGQYDDIVDIFWASGACFVVRAEVFKKLNGFDDRFFAHMEEIDLCWRIWRNGYKVAAVPLSAVYHLGGASLDYNDPRKLFLNIRNNHLMLYKNLTSDIFKKISHVRHMIEYLMLFFYFCTGKISNAKAILSAYKDFNDLKKYYKPANEASILKLLYPRSILVDYYLKNKKKFSKLKWKI
ncbi:MAG: glycosyltransferase family 2 protein [Bacteroidales bacterium]|jgi:GT2 family glycosyltransferase|nr:glycosyltransferase family 2 protein [Bacteroidales bacterium]MDD3756073.1 glycosyltransferase family 2 protein [Bacteroidales bacterium]MDI9575940.1 glycosyltransferase family 2 protein [Bacteroidota bacterium]MDY0401261.1 glycosyltransferase family 2 protein [Bacteroidales bacterium]HHW59797.1 glycosyltransferase family 2 protein [Bacteroidales bacterium]